MRLEIEADIVGRQEARVYVCLITRVFMGRGDGAGGWEAGGGGGVSAIWNYSPLNRDK